MTDYESNMKVTVSKVGFNNGAFAVMADYDSINNCCNYIVVKNGKATVVQYKTDDFLVVYNIDYEKIKDQLNKGDDTLTKILSEEKKNIDINTVTRNNNNEEVFFNFINNYLKYML